MRRYAVACVYILNYARQSRYTIYNSRCQALTGKIVDCITVLFTLLRLLHSLRIPALAPQTRQSTSDEVQSTKCKDDCVTKLEHYTLNERVYHRIR